MFKSYESHTEAFQISFPTSDLSSITSLLRLLFSATSLGQLTEVAAYLSNFDPDGNVRPFFGSNQGLPAVAILRPWLSKYTAGVWRGCDCVCVFMLFVCMCVRLSGRCQHTHHDPSHLGTANWQLISRIDSVVRSQVPAPLPTPPTR